jgi:hypothetical protein
MSIDGEKIEKLKAYVSRIYEIFEKRPGMLGAPDEICVALTFLDNVNDILTGDVDFYGDKEVSWYDFLIEKKLIVGAENKLKIRLRIDEQDYSYLQELRSEYLSWKEGQKP